jgi:hypothetical protein
MMAKRTPIDSATKDYEGGADNYPIKPMWPLGRRTVSRQGKLTA